MAKSLHAIDYLAKPAKYPATPVCVVFGDEPFLRRLVLDALRDDVLSGDDSDFSLTTFDGPAVKLKNNVFNLNSRLLGRTARRHEIDKSSPGTLQVKGFRQRKADFLDLHSQQATLHRATVPKLVDNIERYI